MQNIRNELNIEETKDFLNQRKTTYNNATYNLDNVIHLFEKLHCQTLQCPVIHVTGTNGKGSTCAMLESIYRVSGLKTGLFTSPYLISVYESIKVSNQNITEQQFNHLFNQIYKVANEIESENPTYRFSFFEYQTAIALLHFIANKVNVVILEVGMGGRLDATNAIQQKTYSVITTISLDHENILGNTLEAIAREKSGIIRPNSLVFIGFNINDGPKSVIQEIASEQHSTIYQPTKIELIFNDQTTDYQNYNASTAKLVAEKLNDFGQISIQSDSIEKGIRSFHWPARWQKYHYKNKLLIFDGAHNEEGAVAASYKIKELNEPPTIIFGSNKEGRAKKMLKIFLPISKHIFISKSTHERALDTQKIIGITDFADSEIESIELADIPKLIESSDEKVFDISGSLYLIGDVMRLLKLDL